MPGEVDHRVDLLDVRRRDDERKTHLQADVPGRLGPSNRSREGAGLPHERIVDLGRGTVHADVDGPKTCFSEPPRTHRRDERAVGLQAHEQADPGCMANEFVQTRVKERLSTCEGKEESAFGANFVNHPVDLGVGKIISASRVRMIRQLTVEVVAMDAS